MLQKGDPQRVLTSEATKEKKIILLWFITRIDYRGQIGEEAVEALAEIIPDEEIRKALFSIVGFASARPELHVKIDTFARMSAGILY